MSQLRLVPMCPEIAEAAYAAAQELPPENGFSFVSHGVSWEEFQAAHIKGMMDSAAGVNIPAGRVPQAYHFLFDGEKAVGLFKLRPVLNDSLRQGAGHIGYGICKSQRGKGYATAGLALAVEAIRPLVEEDELYLSVNRDNQASLQVMLRNGAYIHHEDEMQCYTRIPLGQKLRLVPISMDIAQAAYDCLQDLQPENGFENSFCGHTWAQFIEKDIPGMMNAAVGIDLRPEHVPQTSYILMDEDVGVGLFKLRHHLNDGLRGGAGHIGYGIRKSMQGKGYATAGLALAVQEARRIIPEDEVYMSVNKNNPASLRVMLKNGAYIHHENEDHHFTRIKLR